MPTALVSPATGADEQKIRVPRDELATPFNLVPAASAVEAAADNKKHDDDEEKGSGVHGSLLPKSNFYPVRGHAHFAPGHVLVQGTSSRFETFPRYGENVSR